MLALLGLAMGALYALFFVQPFWLPHLQSPPPVYEGEAFADFLRASGSGTTALYAGVILALFGGYGLAWRLCARPAAGLMRVIGGGAVLFSLVLIGMKPVMSGDMYDYAFRARMALVYGLNPFVETPRAAIVDAWAPHLYWFDVPIAYGPLWYFLTLPTAWLAGDSMLVALVALKVVAALAYLACVQLIAVTLGTFAPAHQAGGTLLFAWNPLILLELVGNGHNDGVMLAFMLLAALAAMRGRWWLAAPAAMAAILIKMAAVLILPFLALLALRAVAQDRRRLRSVAGGAALALGLTVLLYTFIWAGPETLLHVARSQADIVLNSPVGLMVELGQRVGIEASASGRLLRLAMSGAVLLLAAVWLWEQWRGRRGWLTATFDTTLVYLALASVWFWPWYVTWLLAPAALLLDRRRQLIAIVFSLSVFALRLCQVLIDRPPNDWMVATPFMFGPPIVLFVTLLWSEHRRRDADQGEAPPTAAPTAKALQEV
jgi:hypothetical protein